MTKHKKQKNRDGAVEIDFTEIAYLVGYHALTAESREAMSQAMENILGQLTREQQILALTTAFGVLTYTVEIARNSSPEAEKVVSGFVSDLSLFAFADALAGGVSDV